jgi:hypothetical protein
MVRVQKKHAAEPQVRAGTTGLPCAMVLRLIRTLPGDQAFLPPSSADRSADLAPALGRQDHTTSPSAISHSSRQISRPSHPAPNVRDDREAPLLWVRDRQIIVLICPTWQCPSGCGTLARRAVYAWRICAPLLPRHCERERSNPESHRRCSLDCFVALLLAMTITLSAVIPGRRASGEPGIHIHRLWLWIPGLRLKAHPGMTVERMVVPNICAYVSACAGTTDEIRDGMEASSKLYRV